MRVPFNKLSKATLWVCIELFADGVIIGFVIYRHRSHVLEKHIAGSAAIPAHIVVFLIAALSLLAVGYYRSKHPKAGLILLAPFSETAMERFRRTMTLRAGFTFGNVVRLVYTAFLSAFLLFNFIRSGAQVIGGLDPNFVINAWGGPTYLGASLFHWFDGVMLFYVEAILLNLIMVKKRSATLKSKDSTSSDTR